VIFDAFPSWGCEAFYTFGEIGHCLSIQIHADKVSGQTGPGEVKTLASPVYDGDIALQIIRKDEP
jgi:hypothetical protein